MFRLGLLIALTISLTAASEPLVLIHGAEAAPTADTTLRYRMELLGFPQGGEVPVDIWQDGGEWRAHAAGTASQHSEWLDPGDDWFRFRLSIGSSLVELVLAQVAEVPDSAGFRDGDARHGITGRWTVGSGGERTQGVVHGHAVVHSDPGRWNGGLAVDGGVRVHFSGSEQQRNRHFARAIRCRLPDMVDFSRYSALSFALADAQHISAEAALTLWLVDANGVSLSCRNCLPLIETAQVFRVPLHWFAAGSAASPAVRVGSFDWRSVASVLVGVTMPMALDDATVTIGDVALISTSDQSVEAVVIVDGRPLQINRQRVLEPALLAAEETVPLSWNAGAVRDVGNVGPFDPEVEAMYLREADIPDPDALLSEIVRQGAAGGPLQAVWRRFTAKERRQLEAGGAGSEALVWINRQMSEDLHRDPDLGNLGRVADRAAWPVLEHLDGKKLAAATAARLNRLLLHLAVPDLIPAPPQEVPERIALDCWFGAGEPATQLVRADWEAFLEQRCQRYIARAAASQRQAYLELFDRPGDDWAPGGVHARTRYYEQKGRESGRPVHFKESGEVFTLFRWLAEPGGWTVQDPSAFSDWPGLGSGVLYDELVQHVGQLVHAQNASVRLLAGWGIPWHRDDWAVWDMLYRPTIDRCVQELSGITMQCDLSEARVVPAAAEMLSAYLAQTHRMSLPLYLTRVMPDGAAGTADWIHATIADVVTLMARVPDKVAVRFAASPPGGEAAMACAFEFLSQLRGGLIGCTSDASDVISVACHNAESDELRIAVVNRAQSERNVSLNISAPPGTVLLDGVVDRCLAAPAWRLDTLPIGPGPGMMVEHWRNDELGLWLSLPPGECRLVRLQLAGDPQDLGLVQRRQYYADDVLAGVGPDRSWYTRVSIPRQRLADAQKAWLRLALEGVGEREAAVRVAGGRLLLLPPVMGVEHDVRIVELPLQLRELSQEAVELPPELRKQSQVVGLHFMVLPGAHSGYRVAAASIVLQSE